MPVWRRDTCSSKGSCAAGQFNFNDFPPRMHLRDGGITASPRECLCGKNLNFIGFLRLCGGGIVVYPEERPCGELNCTRYHRRIKCESQSLLQRTEQNSREAYSRSSIWERCDTRSVPLHDCEGSPDVVSEKRVWTKEC